MEGMERKTIVNLDNGMTVNFKLRERKKDS